MWHSSTTIISECLTLPECLSTCSTLSMYACTLNVCLYFECNMQCKCNASPSRLIAARTLYHEHDGAGLETANGKTSHLRTLHLLQTLVCFSLIISLTLALARLQALVGVLVDFDDLTVTHARPEAFEELLPERFMTRQITTASRSISVAASNCHGSVVQAIQSANVTCVDVLPSRQNRPPYLKKGLTCGYRCCVSDTVRPGATVRSVDGVRRQCVTSLAS
jgi:hypothetical protein